MSQRSRSAGFYFLLTICLFFIFSCGIEDYPYINPIPQSNVFPENNKRAVVRIPSDSPGTTFTNFAVFYRIYVSDTLLQSTTSTSSYSAINSTLASDYNTFKGYIDSTTLVNVDMKKLFSDRGYYYLGFENDYLSNVLSTSSLGKSITFDFSSSKMPTMTLGNSTYELWRSNDGGKFNPEPNRYFRNSRDLFSPDNINNQINADVVNKANMDGDMRYTYAAMFIVAVGINPASYSNIYSTPSLIHVFLLPD
jgi:hypothetical protein